MSILLHGAKFSNQILPQEKCIIRDNVGTFRKLKQPKMWFVGTNFRDFIILGKFLDGKLEKVAQIFPKKLDFEQMNALPNFIP